MPINYQGVPNLLGSYEAGQNAGAQDFALAMEADKMVRQKQKEKDIKEAVAELRKSGIPYNQEESASMAMAAAVGDYKMAQQVNAAAITRLQREKLAQARYPATIPGQVGTQQQPAVPTEAQGPQYQEGLGEQMYNAGQLPSTMEAPVMGQVPNPDAWKGQALIAGAHDKELAAQLKELESTHYQHFPAGSLVVDSKGNQFIVPQKEATNTINDFATFYRGQKADNPGITETDISKKWHDLKMAEAKASAEARGMGFANARVADVFDNFTGQPAPFMTIAQAMEGNKQQPGRYTLTKNKPEFQAVFSSYKNLQKQYDMTNQAIRQADNLGTALLAASDNFTRTNYPAPNKIVTWLGTQAGNQKTQAEIGRFKVALLGFSREYMRVVTGAARSVQELSIKAQGTADDIMSKFDSWEVLKEKIAQAKIEMAYTKKSYQDQLNEQRGALGLSPNAEDTQPPPSGGVKVWNSTTKSFDVR